MKNTDMIWEERIKEYKGSGKSIKEFCTGKDFTLDAFKYHMYKEKGYRKNISGKVTAKNSTETGRQDFVNIGLIESPKSGLLHETGIRLDLKGVSINVRRGFDKGLLLEIVGVLTA